jgi:hypothetical protein
MARTTALGISFLCDRHNRYVKAGLKPGDLMHTSGNQEGPCSSQRFTITVRREADRAEVLAELAAMAGEDGDHG